MAAAPAIVALVVGRGRSILMSLPRSDRRSATNYFSTYNIIICIPGELLFSRQSLNITTGKVEEVVLNVYCLARLENPLLTFKIYYIIYIT